MRKLQSKWFGQLRYDNCILNRNMQTLQRKKKKLTSALAVSSSSQECPFRGLVVNMTTNFPGRRIRVSVPGFWNGVVCVQTYQRPPKA